MADVPLLYFLEFTASMDSSCPSRCSCRLMSKVSPLLVRVRCKNASMHSLPDVLPVRN